MGKIIKLSESDLTKIVKRVINEEFYNPDKLYNREIIIRRLKSSPSYIRKYMRDLPVIKMEGSDAEYTKIPQVIFQYLYGSF